MHYSSSKTNTSHFLSRDTLENGCEETKVKPAQETKSPITNLVTDIFFKSGESVIIANIYNLVGL